MRMLEPQKSPHRHNTSPTLYSSFPRRPQYLLLSPQTKQTKRQNIPSQLFEQRQLMPFKLRSPPKYIDMLSKNMISSKSGQYQMKRLDQNLQKLARKIESLELLEQTQASQQNKTRYNALQRYIPQGESPQLTPMTVRESKERHTTTSQQAEQHHLSDRLKELLLANKDLRVGTKQQKKSNRKRMYQIARQIARNRES